MPPAPYERTLRVANVAEAAAGWRWIFDLAGPPWAIEVASFSMALQGVIPRLPGGRGLRRALAALSLRAAARKRGFDLIVSHGPLASAWSAAMLGDSKGRARHVAFAFNFTDLPTGPRRVALTRAFRAVDEFVVITRAEIGLYASYFGIPEEKLTLAPWGVTPPIREALPRRIAGPYIAALGGEARDYATLCEAARLAPDIRFFVIARPRNFRGVSPPPNMTVEFNVPFEDAWSVVAHAAAAVLPLRSRDTPCGLVTLVGAMHIGQAQIVTDAIGVAEYARNEETALLVPPRDAPAIVEAARRLLADRALASRLGEEAQRFAANHCSESATIDFLKRRLEAWFPA